MSATSITPHAARIFLRHTLGLSPLLLGFPGLAHAQSVNYSDLEDMFGEPVTTSVTGKPQRASEAPAALVIITRDDIRRSPASDIPGLIQAYADIDVARWTAGQSDISIRGGLKAYNASLLVLVNGRQVYLDHYGMTNWAGLGVQLDEIQQIEIVKGPNSALFGFNAASGVINIITIDPLQTQRMITTLEAGTEGQLRVSQSAAFKVSELLGLRLSGGYEKSDERDGFAASQIAGSAFSFPKAMHQEASGEVIFRPDAATQASLGVTHSLSRQNDFALILVSLPHQYSQTAIDTHLSHDTGWGVISANAFRNWADIKVGADQPGSLAFDNKVFVASTNTLIRAGTADILRLGLEYRTNELRVVPGYPGATRYKVFAGSGMWEHRFGDLATFTVAGRVDHLKLGQKGPVDQPTIFTKEDFDRSITAWSFNGAVLFKLDDYSSLRIAGGRGIQTPSLLALGERVSLSVPGLPVPFVFAGDPGLAPTVVKSAEIGLARQLDQIGGRLELTVFYDHSSDLVGVPGLLAPPRAGPPAVPFLINTYRNVGSFESYGLSASLAGRFKQSWSWMLNYSWTKANQDITGNQGGMFPWLLALDSATPEHKIKGQLSYERGPWLATGAARYTSRIDQLKNNPATPPMLVRIGANIVLDAKVAYKVNNALTFAITGENLTNNHNADLSPVPAERRLHASLQVRF